MPSTLPRQRWDRRGWKRHEKRGWKHRGPGWLRRGALGRATHRPQTTTPVLSFGLSRAAVAGAAIALTLAAPAAARAQRASYDNRFEAFLMGQSVIGQPGEQRTIGAWDSITETLDVGPAGAAVSGSARGGKLGAIALTDVNRSRARASVSLHTLVTFTRPVGLGTFQPIELYTHGSFFDASDGRRTGSGVTEYGAQLRVLDAWDDEVARAGDRMEYWSRNFLPMQNQRTVWLDLPAATAPGQTISFELILTVWAYADNGFGADASHTGSLYIPTIAGQEWTALGGALDGQAHPDWAQLPSSTTTPEPATVALLGTGGLALLALRRRMRTA